MEKHLIQNFDFNPDMIKFLQILIRNRSQTEKVFDCRIFDKGEAEALDVRIKDFNTLNDYPQLILYEGWFDKSSKEIELTEKRKMDYETVKLTKQEIQHQIEALDESAGTLAYFQSAGPSSGGPMGRGAAIVEVSQKYLKNQKGKKYQIYTSNVFIRDLVGEKIILWESNKPEDIAQWIMESYRKRVF